VPPRFQASPPDSDAGPSRALAVRQSAHAWIIEEEANLRAAGSERARSKIAGDAAREDQARLGLVTIVKRRVNRAARKNALRVMARFSERHELDPKVEVRRRTLAQPLQRPSGTGVVRGDSEQRILLEPPGELGERAATERHVRSEEHTSE